MKPIPTPIMIPRASRVLLVTVLFWGGFASALLQGLPVPPAVAPRAAAVSCADFDGDEPACTAAGCGWETADCGPDFDEQEACDAQSGCSWGTCADFHNAQSDCTEMGCSFAAESPCSAFDSDEDGCGGAGCTWDTNLEDCSIFSTEQACNDQGCVSVYAYACGEHDNDEGGCISASAEGCSAQYYACSEHDGDESACNAAGCTYDTLTSNCNGDFFLSCGGPDGEYLSCDGEYIVSSCTGTFGECSGDGFCSGDYETGSCVGALCGDGVVDAGEDCDDGNDADGDGCSAACAEESGYSCAGQPSNCLAVCGDGILIGAEECDDGNQNNGDGCDSCQAASGWSCSGEPSNCGPVCGDGLLRGPEECDDGGDAADDGCDVYCRVEEGWSCDDEPSVCEPAGSSGSSASSAGSSAGAGAALDAAEPAAPASGGGRGAQGGSRNGPRVLSEQDRIQPPAESGDADDRPSRAAAPALPPRPADRLRMSDVAHLLRGLVDVPLQGAARPSSPAVRLPAPSQRRRDPPARRGDVVRTVLALFNVPVTRGPAPFHDVAPDGPYAEAVATAAAIGLVTGDTDGQGNRVGTFRPTDPINAIEMQLLIRRLRRLGFRDPR